MRSYVLHITHLDLLSDKELAYCLYDIANFIRAQGKCLSQDGNMGNCIRNDKGDEVGEWQITRPSK